MAPSDKDPYTALHSLGPESRAMTVCELAAALRRGVPPATTTPPGRDGVVLHPRDDTVAILRRHGRRAP